MARLGVLMALALVLTLGNTGCYLDQLQAEQRANRVLQEDLARAKSDLQDAEAMNKQKDTQIDGLTKQLATKDEMVNSLSAENTSLRDALKKAQEILEAQAGKGVGGPITIVKNALPEPLNAALSELAKQYPDVLEFDPKTGVVRWKADLLFPSGRDVLTSAEKILAALKKFAAIVNSADAARFDVIIIGHTDTDPIKHSGDRFKSNWDLSAYRAIAVMNLMLEQQVLPERLGIMGYGEFRPIADNSTNEGKAKNRRVEIYLVPKGSVQSVGAGVYQNPDQGLAYVKPADLKSRGPQPARSQ